MIEKLGCNSSSCRRSPAAVTADSATASCADAKTPKLANIIHDVRWLAGFPPSSWYWLQWTSHWPYTDRTGWTSVTTAQLSLSQSLHRRHQRLLQQLSRWRSKWTHFQMLSATLFIIRYCDDPVTLYCVPSSCICRVCAWACEAEGEATWKAERINSTMYCVDDRED